MSSVADASQQRRQHLKSLGTKAMGCGSTRCTLEIPRHAGNGVRVNKVHA
jgi:hypothetical protein